MINLRLQRRISSLLLVILALASAATAGQQLALAPDTRVMLFVPNGSCWTLSTFAQAKPGSEFFFDNQLCRTNSSGRADVVLGVTASKLLEADLPPSSLSRVPKRGDVVQVLDKDGAFVQHASLDTVQPGSTIRFEGRAYSVKPDHSLVTAAAPSVASPLGRIEITPSAWRHICDRHTTGGAKSAGASIFNPREDIQMLIKNAQLAAPVLESNGYTKRVFDAGHAIGFDTGKNRRQTSTYWVITTQTGKLVTAYPVVH